MRHPSVLRAFWMILVVLVLGAQAGIRAHDVPDQVDIQSYIKPSGTELQVLLRIPLLALSETNLPKDGPGYLAMKYLDPALAEAANQAAAGIIFLENDDRLSQFALSSARISLPSDKSFDSYDGALARVRGEKLPESTQLYYNQGYLDLELHYPIRSGASDFAVQMLLGQGVANRTVTFVTFVRADGAVRKFHLVDQTGAVRLDPSLGEALRVFLTTGFFQFIDGIDHVLFLIVLALPFRRVRDLAMAVGAFAIGHTLSLLVSTSALSAMPADTWLPTFIGALVAFSIVYVAVENAIGASLRHRWMLALGFGLVHGVGFALALRDAIQYAGGHGLAALLSFNIGIELGQLIILAIAVPAFTLLFTHVVAERVGIIAVSVLAGHAAWHWMADGYAALRLMSGPALDLALAATVVRWLLVLVIVAGGGWFLSGFVRRKPDADAIPEKSIVDSRR